VRPCDQSRRSGAFAAGCTLAARPTAMAVSTATGHGTAGARMIKIKELCAKKKMIQLIFPVSTKSLLKYITSTFSNTFLQLPDALDANLQNFTCRELLVVD
jgi:hypothetical protein